ncbi:hypothetical protein [Pseudoxanthomonas sp. J35]|uniref:lipopolysaccharide biosynthesis protein n=1 Tax=Pseudoxanthomonas sp. J35 TaxID=935852 RepID=UPI0012EC99F8|nr:hypothetical protein [Pseudoxanthomonas sp. J35]
MIGLLRYRPGAWLRSGGTLLAWMLARAAAQFITLLLLAKTLGASEYGRLVVVISLATLVTPLVGLGLSNVVLRNGAKDPGNLPLYLGIATHWWAWTLLPGLALAMSMLLWLFPDGAPLLAGATAVGAEVAASSLGDLRARHCQAERRIGASGVINAGLPLLRFPMLGLLFFIVPSATIELVLWVYTVSSVTYLLILLRPLRALPHRGRGGEAMSGSSGLPFTVAIVSVRLQSEFNKPILAHSAFSLAGSYNVAQRFVELASMPLLALQEALWPRLHAHASPLESWLRTGAWLLFMSLACSVVLWLAAPFLPWLLGQDYTSAMDTLRMLAWLPTLQTLRSLLNFHAIHFGRMRWIGWTYAGGAVTSVLIVATLVPVNGLAGAVVAAYASEVMMTVLLVGGMKFAKA